MPDSVMGVFGTAGALVLIGAILQTAPELGYAGTIMIGIGLALAITGIVVMVGGKGLGS